MERDLQQLKRAPPVECLAVIQEYLWLVEIPHIPGIPTEEIILKYLDLKKRALEEAFICSKSSQHLVFSMCTLVSWRAVRIYQPPNQCIIL